MASRKTNASKQSYYDNFISSVDFYGARPELTYKGKKFLSSGFGSVITFFVFSLSTLCSVYISWIYFKRVSSETNVDKIHLRDPVGFNLTKENLPFVFGMQDVTGAHFIDDSIYTTEVKYVRIHKKVINGELTVDTKETLLDLIPCSEANLDPVMFDNLPLKYMNCLKQLVDPSLKMEITGEWESPDFGFLQFYIKRCTGPNCKTEAEINSKLKVSYFAVFYVNYAIMASNFTDPVYRYQASFFTPTSCDFTKEIGMRMADNEVLTHNTVLGYLPPEKIKFTATDFFTTELVNVAVDSNPENLIYMRLRMGKMKTVTTRVYGTAFESLAELGGIINLITFAALIISMPATRTHLLLDFISAFKPASQKSTPHAKPARNQSIQDPKFSHNPKHPSPVNNPNFFSNSRDFMNQDVVQMPSGQVYSRSPPVEYPKKIKKLNFKAKGSQSQKFSTPDLGLNQEKAPIYNTNYNRQSPDDHHIQEELPQPLADQAQRTESLQMQTPFKKQSLNNLKSKTLQIRNAREERNSKITACSIYAYSYFPFFVSRNSPISQAVKEAETKVASRLDFVNFLKILADFEKLLRLLLTPEQLILFELAGLEELTEVARSTSQFDFDQTTEGHLAKGQFGGAEKAALNSLLKKDPDYLSNIDKALIYSLSHLIEDEHNDI